MTESEPTTPSTPRPPIEVAGGAAAPQHAASRAERRALGRRLLDEGGMLWSAVPVEWPTERKGSVADPPALPGTAWRVWTSLGALIRRPRASFAYVHEPVDHGAVLTLLHAVRLPLWLVLVAVLGVRALTSPAKATVLRPIHAYLDPRLCEVLALWLLLMVPIGVPLLYFALGIATHVALALSGGAPRSIAASMRAAGYALAPGLLAISAIDVALHLGWLSGLAYLVLLAAVGLAFFLQLGQAVAGTHAISVIRGHIVAVVPLALVLAVQLGRALLLVPDLPGMAPAQASAYFIP